MKAFLINPETRTIEQIEYTGNWRDIYPLIDCDCFTTMDIDGSNTVFVDDEGLLHGGERHFFVLGEGYQPLCGKGLVLGYDEEGETVEPSITLEQLQSRVTWPTEFELFLQHLHS